MIFPSLKMPKSQGSSVGRKSSAMQKEKTQSVEEFERDFPELTSQVREKIEPLFNKSVHPNLKFIVCKMKVKGGKRVIVEYLTQKSKHAKVPVSNYFITAWNRKADASQRNEIAAYNVHVHIPSSKKKISTIISSIQQSQCNKRIHLDELDFGSGDDGLLSQVYTRLKNDDNSLWILYSATPEELICCQKWVELEESGQGVFVEINPPPAYMGMKEYIDRGLMMQSDSMFNFDEGTLTDHGKSVLQTAGEKYLNNNNKNISIIRITGKHKKQSRFNWVRLNHNVIQQFFDEAFGTNSIDVHLVDIGSKSENSVDWDKYKTWKEKSIDCFFVYLVEQSACRATELRCHHRLNFYHTHRYAEEPSMNTIIQDQERCVYYKIDKTHDHASKYPEYVNMFPSCVIYGDVDVANYSAGYISLVDLLNKRKDLCPSSRTEVLRYYQRLRPMIIEAPSEIALEQQIRGQLPDAPLPSKTYNEREADGFMKCTIRSAKRVYSYEEVIKTNYGIDAKTIFSGRRFVCYKNASDISTETYVALINTGNRHDNDIKLDSQKSMYSK